ncbi:MAG: phage tail protein, partial [Candidatus Hodarchaeales archaeon]
MEGVASANPYLGEIILFAGNFAPRGWAFCDGQLLLISQNTALFSLLGITYGGDGRTTFALPDLRGRVPVHAGTGPGLTPRPLGQKGGSETGQCASEFDNMQPYTTLNYIIA